MVGFNADIMLDLYGNSTTVNYRPFSKNLMDVMNSSRSLESIRAQIVVNDDSYLSHLLLIDANLDFAGKNAVAQNKQMEDLLIELQELLLAGERYDVSENLLFLTRQLLFKQSADLLLASESKEYADLVPILSTLSYQYANFDKFDQNDGDIAAWSALLALDSLTLFLSTFDDLDQQSWNDPELGSRIVRAVIPKDGAIRRLREDIYQVARDISDGFSLEMDEELPKKLADFLRPMIGHEKVLHLCTMIIRRSISKVDYFEFDAFHFFQRFVQGLTISPIEGRFNSSDYKNFTSTDFAIFLEWITQWSLICQPKIEVVSRLSFTPEQIAHWKSIALLVTNPIQIKVEDQLRISTVIRVVRMHKNIRNVRLLYGIFKFIKEKEFPEEWILLYANSILKNIVGFVENPRDHLFRLKWDESISSNTTVEEEDRIHQEVTRYLGRHLAEKGEYRAAVETLQQFEDLSRETMAQIYEVNKKWSEDANGAEKELVMQKNEKLKKEFLKKFGVPIFRPVTPVEPINVTPFRPSFTSKVEPKFTPKEDMFYSPASITTREMATSTDVSFVSAMEDPITPRSNLDTPVVGSKLMDISDHSSPPQEPEPTKIKEKEKEHPLDDSLAYLDNFSAEDEEEFLLDLAEQKLKITQQMFDDLNKGNKNSFIPPSTGVTSLEDRYKKAVEDMEKLKRELEQEREKKATPNPVIKMIF